MGCCGQPHRLAAVPSPDLLVCFPHDLMQMLHESWNDLVCTCTTKQECLQCKSEERTAVWRHPMQGKGNPCPDREAFFDQLVCADSHVYVHLICASKPDKERWLREMGMWFINPAPKDKTDLTIGPEGNNVFLPCRGPGWQVGTSGNVCRTGCSSYHPQPGRRMMSGGR